jgi:23S rRNA (cytosine1962-C5)-methyltransferase
MILRVLKETVTYKSIYQKKRFDTKGKYVDEDDFVCGEEPTFPIVVVENGVKFPVYLNDGPMIGFFLDQKDVRKTIRASYSKNKNVLNTFSYTGAFSVYAALGGAKMTTSVDLANRSLPKTKELFELNGINPEQETIIVEDVFNYFKYAKRKNLMYDLVILDPPSFARSKKHTFSAAKDYSSLLAEAIEITNKNGVIVASTNHSGFGMKKFRQMVHQAFVITGDLYEIEEQFGLPDDFRVDTHYPEGYYLKVLFIRKTS